MSETYKDKIYHTLYYFLLACILLGMIFTLFYIIIPNFNNKGATYKIDGCDYIVTHSDKCTNPKHKKVK
jgi:hypothetical protein